MLAIRRATPIFSRPSSAAALQRLLTQRSNLSTTSEELNDKIERFKTDVAAHLPSDGQRTVFATTWLATDNVFLALMRKHFPEVLDGMNLVAVDTLHLFPETLECAANVQDKFGKQASLYYPNGVSTLDDFQVKYGICEFMDAAEFDFVSKVEPFKRALHDAKQDILITGRRMDQAKQRIELKSWEDTRRVFNPMADWTWSDITAYVDSQGVPVNRAHNYVFRADTPIDATKRHLPALPWTKENLGKPFWRCSDTELRGNSEIAYVFKSFGDLHTSVPVTPSESERAGRFVRQPKGESTSAGDPHGGALMDLRIKDPAQAQSLLASCSMTIELNERQACDVFCLVNGAFSPLKGFMDETSYNSVVETMRLPGKQLFGLPVTLDIPSPDGARLGDKVLLRWAGEDVAILEAESIFKPDKVREAKEVYGTSSLEHPTVHSLIAEQGTWCIGGKIHGLASPTFKYPTKTPKEVRLTLPEGKNVVAFQVRNPIHRAHFELLKCAQRDIADSILLVHPTCGPTQSGDIDGLAVISTYEALKDETKDECPMFRWAYLPYSMKMAGPREAIQHMIIRKNYGATHFIIGRDMAGTHSTLDGKDFYGPYDAQEMGKKYASELGLTVTHYEKMVYAGEEEGYVQESEAKKRGVKVDELSGTEFRRRLQADEEIPEWFAFRSVVETLRKAGDKAFCV